MNLSAVGLSPDAFIEVFDSKICSDSYIGTFGFNSWAEFVIYNMFDYAVDSVFVRSTDNLTIVIIKRISILQP